MKKASPFVNKALVLERFPGRSGWTFARIAGVSLNESEPFGWIRVTGKIDNHTIRNYSVMTMSDGALFLPVKSEIRQRIRKEEGDIIHVTLFLDEAAMKIPEDFATCMQQQAGILDEYLNYTEAEKKAFIDWIYGAETEITKSARMIRAINLIAHGKKLRAIVT